MEDVGILAGGGPAPRTRAPMGWRGAAWHRGRVAGASPRWTTAGGIPLRRGSHRMHSRWHDRRIDRDELGALFAIEWRNNYPPKSLWQALGPRDRSDQR